MDYGEGRRAGEREGGPRPWWLTSGGGVGVRAREEVDQAVKRSVKSVVGGKNCASFQGVAGGPIRGSPCTHLSTGTAEGGLRLLPPARPLPPAGTEGEMSSSGVSSHTSPILQSSEPL